MAEDYADILAQQAALARRQKLLDAMTLQGQGAPIQANNGLDRVIQLLAKVGGGFAGQQAQGKLDAQQTGLQSQYSQGLTGELQKYLAARQGIPSAPVTDPQGPPTEEGQAPAPVGMTAGTPPNPQAALVSAISSRYPELQKIGNADLLSLNKAESSFGEAKPGINPATGKPDQFTTDKAGNIKWLGTAPIDKGVALGPDQRLASPTTGATIGTAPDGMKPPVLGAELGMRGDAAKDYYQIGPNGKYLKVDNAPRTVVNTHLTPAPISVSISKGETAFAEALGKDTAAEFKEARSKANQGYSTLSTVGQMRELEKKGMFSGATAGVAQNLAAFGKAFNIPVDTAKLANSEAYQKEFAKVIADQVTGTAGRSITDADRKQIEQSLPSMLQSAAGRNRIYQIMEAGANQSIKRHTSMQNHLLKQYPEHAGMLTMNPVDTDVLPNQAPLVPGEPSDKKPKVVNW